MSSDGVDLNYSAYDGLDLGSPQSSDNEIPAGASERIQSAHKQGALSVVFSGPSNGDQPFERARLVIDSSFQEELDVEPT